MNGALDAWPKEASDLRAEGGEYLAGHIFFPNSWTGPNDLSARLRLGHDGQKLYIGVEVRDSVISEKDGCAVKLSRNDYVNWRSDKVKFCSTWNITPPRAGEVTFGAQETFKYTCRRTPTGYIVEGSIPLADLGLKPGRAIGFMVTAGDGDNTPNLSSHSWARKQELSIPNKPNFTYWEDARNCAKLIVE